MNIVRYIKDPIKLPLRFVLLLDNLGLHFSDKFYLTCCHRIFHERWMNWENPTGFCEKLNWLKIHDRKPIYTTMVDKIKVKEYVANIIGDEYIIPTLGVYNSAEEIDWARLPQKFVVKCNHDSGSYVICKDKNIFDKERAKKRLTESLKHNLFWSVREWPYKNVEKKILVEELLEDPSGDLRDYKFFCFNGEVKAVFVASERNNPNSDTCFDYFDADFNHLPITTHFQNSVISLKKPENFELMKELAGKLSKGIPHVRVDFYNTNGKVYFGEFTFYHDGAVFVLRPYKYEELFGSWIDLPQ